MLCSSLLQENSIQKVIKLYKENLDKIEGQFLNLQHPPSIFFEVGDNFIRQPIATSVCYVSALCKPLLEGNIAKSKSSFYLWKCWILFILIYIYISR